MKILVVALLTVMLVAGCGKKGDPLPPAASSSLLPN